MDQSVVLNLTVPWLEDGKPVMLSREERIRLFGIDCSGPFGDGIFFRGGEWSPGGEYVQVLKVKNVSMKLKKLKYKAPANKYFSLAFPELIVLSPGTSEDIQVVFRPLVLEVYEDTLYFKLEGMGERVGFHVPIRAFISTLQLAIPSGLDFGLCPTAVISRRTFSIENTGQVPAPFKWSVPAPFKLAPAEGEVPVGQSANITASLLPIDASVYVSQAFCTIGEGVNAMKPEPLLALKVSAIGKYAHLAFSDAAIEFGDVYVGGVYKQTEGNKTEGTKNTSGAVVKEIVLHNRSLVEAHFNSRRLETDRDSVFTLSPMSGIIPAQDCVTVSISFRPKFAGTFSLDTFEYFTPGGSQASFVCSGTAVSPGIELFKKEDPRNVGLGLPNSINFRDVKVGETSRRILFLKNTSPLPAYFCFANVLQEDGIFTLSQTRGVIPPLLDVHIQLVFSPVGPSNYYRRVFCLIENQYPLFVDLMGTGYIPAKADVKEQRPAPLRQAHIQAFRNRVAAGLGRLSPEELEERLATEGPSELFAKIGTEGTQPLHTSVTPAQQPVTRSGEASRNEVAVAQEFFEDPTSSSAEVAVSCEEIDFGFVSHNATSERKLLRVTNNTRGKVIVLWACPSDPEEDGQMRQGAFIVSPDVAEVSPQKSFEFRVAFSPKMHSRYYCQQVEAYVFFKNQRTFRLVNDSVLSPPWSFAVRVAGHTFSGDPFLCKVLFNLPERKLSFPACFVGDSVYQSLRLTNRGNTPAFFTFKQDATGVFTVKPTSGLIPSEDFQIVEVRFKPNQKGNFVHKLKCDINGQLNEVTLFGQGDTPKLSRIGASMAEAFFLKPTCTGLVAHNSLRLRNASRLPMILKMELQASSSGIFDVSPKIVRLKGNEIIQLTISFAPREQIQYKTRLTLKVKALAGIPPNLRDARQIGKANPAAVLQTLTIPIIGMGGGGALEFSPANLDFGVALVNTLTNRDLTIINQSDCDLAYQLLYCITSKEDRVKGKLQVQPIPKEAGGGNVLAVDKPKGILPARSRTVTRTTFQPSRDGLYNALMVCRISMVDHNGEKIMHSAAENKLLELGDDAREDAAESVADDAPVTLPLTCNFQGRASFPQLVLRDVCVESGGLGCAPSHMWKYLNLAEINKLMATPLTREEVRFNLESSPDLSKLPRFPMPFIPCPLGSVSQVLLFEVCNPGFLKTSFEIHLPNEKDIEMETWADENEPTEHDLMLKAIIDNLKCFEISPKTGTLEPGESMQLRISYAFSSMEYGGKHVLPIWFRTLQGKQFWLDLHGVTLDPNEAYLHLPLGPENVFQLSPVAIGLPLGQAPFQTTEIFNMGLADMEYEIDLAPLEKLWEENWGVKVLVLENSGGTIHAQQPLILKWKFFPLEPKEYLVNLKILFSYGSKNSTKEFVVKAKGYDPRKENPYRELLPDPNKGLVQPESQILKVKNQIAAISADRLFFGRISQRAACQRMLILRNKLLNSHISFSWDVSNYPMIEITPESGTVDPGGLCLIRVKVRTDQTVPCVLNAILPLEIWEAQNSQENKGRKKNKSRLESRHLEVMKATVKFGTNVHRTVVSKITRARDMNLSEARISGNRTATLPTDHRKPPDMLMSQSAPGAKNSSIQPFESITKASVRTEEPSKYQSTFESPTRKILRFDLSAADGMKSSQFMQSSVMSSGEASPTYLYLCIHGEVVDEEWYIRQGEDTERNYIVRPRKFISDSPHIDLPLEKRKGGPPPSSKEQQVYVRNIISKMFREILATDEMVKKLQELPLQPPIPFFKDMKRLSLTARIRGVVKVAGINLKSCPTKEELKNALDMSGCKKIAQFIRPVYRQLDSRKYDTIVPEAFFSSLPREILLQIEVAVQDKENEIILAQRKVNKEEEQAAVRIQCLTRRKLARQQVDKQKLLASEEGQQQNLAATKIQAIQRRRAAQKKVEEIANSKLQDVADQTIKDLEFQAICWKIMENTMFNLLQETLHGDFDLFAAPKQYVLAEELI